MAAYERRVRMLNKYIDRQIRAKNRAESESKMGDETDDRGRAASALYEELRDKMGQFRRGEWNLSYAECLGALEFLKRDLMEEADADGNIGEVGTDLTVNGDDEDIELVAQDMDYDEILRAASSAAEDTDMADAVSRLAECVIQLTRKQRDTKAEVAELKEKDGA